MTNLSEHFARYFLAAQTINAAIVSGLVDFLDPCVSASFVLRAPHKRRPSQGFAERLSLVAGGAREFFSSRPGNSARAQGAVRSGVSVWTSESDPRAQVLLPAVEMFRG